MAAIYTLEQLNAIHQRAKDTLILALLGKFVKIKQEDKDGTDVTNINADSDLMFKFGFKKLITFRKK